MKNRNISLISPLITCRIATGTCTSVDVGWFLFQLSSLPNPNPGNYRDATAFQYDKVSQTIFCGQKEQYYGGSLYDVTTGPYGGGSVLTEPSWDRTRLFNQALAKMNSKLPGANWSEDIAEAKRSAKTANVFSAAKDLAAALTKHGPSIGGFVRGAASAVSAGTLLTKFGLKPLIQNVYDTSVVLLDSSLTDGYTIVGSSNEPLSFAGMVTNQNSGSTLPNSVFREVDGKMGCRFKIWVKPNPAKAPTLSDFTTLNPVLLGWNLLPFSFLVDWVYNISGYMEGLETAFKMASQFNRGYYTELYAVDITERIENKRNSATGLFNIRYGKATKSIRRFYRNRLSSWPLPYPPSLDLDLGSGQLGTAAALLGTLLGRKH